MEAGPERPTFSIGISTTEKHVTLVCDDCFFEICVIKDNKIPSDEGLRQHPDRISEIVDAAIAKAVKQGKAVGIKDEVSGYYIEVYHISCVSRRNQDTVVH